jgi:hypothetical protein
MQNMNPGMNDNDATVAIHDESLHAHDYEKLFNVDLEEISAGELKKGEFFYGLLKGVVTSYVCMEDPTVSPNGEVVLGKVKRLDEENTAVDVYRYNPETNRFALVDSSCDPEDLIADGQLSAGDIIMVCPLMKNEPLVSDVGGDFQDPYGLYIVAESMNYIQASMMAGGDPNEKMNPDHYEEESQPLTIENEVEDSDTEENAKEEQENNENPDIDPDSLELFSATMLLNYFSMYSDAIKQCATIMNEIDSIDNEGLPDSDPNKEN